MALDLSIKRNTLPLDLSKKRPLSPNVAATCRQMACATMPTAQIPLDMSSVPESYVPMPSRKRPLSNSILGDVNGILKTSQPNSAPPFSAKRVCFVASVPSPSTDPENGHHKNTSWCVRRKMAALYRQRIQAKADAEKKTNAPSSPHLEESVCSEIKSDHTDKTATPTPPAPADSVSKPTPDGRALPTDPRNWSRDDVHAWLRQLTSRCRLDDVDVSRFPMNGKGLCLLSPDMFLYRVPASGLLLYTDFMARMRRALALEERANAAQNSGRPAHPATDS